MGISTLFRYLSQKFPLAIIECIEEKPITEDGVQVPFDAWEDNPNGVEFDNLYLDMNSIIHSCTDVDDKPVPKDEEEMMEVLFEYIDRLFRIVRPKQLLYMAVDGVAPRAKINHQRSRSFKASKEAREKSSEISKIRSELALEGADSPPEKTEEHFDSNCILPGTPFMLRLSDYLHYYIHDRMNNIPRWDNVIIILSDASVPGEGKHKIIDYIRRQKTHPDYNPTTEHVLYGNDADLIMLGLATHEPNCRIIREAFKPYELRPCDVGGQSGHVMQDCLGTKLHKKVEHKLVEEECPFVFIDMGILRKHLKQELIMLQLPFQYSFERVLDDWIFMCFFVGNDYLPHLPGFELPESAIDRLVNLYKYTLYKCNGYLTSNGDLNLDRVQLIINALAEDELYCLREQRPRVIPLNIKGKHNAMKGGLGSVEEEIKLGISEYKTRYYNSKFYSPLKEELGILKKALTLQYAQGLCWVLRYYYQGVPSWKWYYPYYCAPFASDFNPIIGISKKIEKETTPLRPLEQLMCVLPAASNKHIPAPWAKLMKDPASPIIDFYPEEFKIEEGMALLPFIDETRLLNALKPYYSMITEAERKRNKRGEDKLYLGSFYHRDYLFLKTFYKTEMDEIIICLDGHIRGTALKSEACVLEGDTLLAPYKRIPITNKKVICIIFRNLEFEDDHFSKIEGNVKTTSSYKPPPVSSHLYGLNHGNSY